jgi:hypothetical protein
MERWEFGMMTPNSSTKWKGRIEKLFSLEQGCKFSGGLNRAGRQIASRA